MNEPWDQIDSVAENLESYSEQLSEMSKTCYRAAQVVKGLREAGTVQFNYNEELRKATEWVKKTLEQGVGK